MSVITIGTRGLNSFVVSVESDISRGLYQFDIVGLGDKAVGESRSRILAALKNCGFTSPKTSQQKITVLLSPASLKKEGSHFDLPIAISYLQACGKIKTDLVDTVVVGELSLQGKILPVRNILLVASAAKKFGYQKLIAPKENKDEAGLVDGLQIICSDNLKEAVDILNGKVTTKNTESTENKKEIESSDEKTLFNIDMVQGQDHAKRAMEIALSGKHSLALYGPPGVGKSLIARSIAELLPPLTKNEAVECRIIQESAGTAGGLFTAPFRDPHHTSSYSSIIGNAHRPGEISLAHNGILFMDEFAEFDRRALEALRQPLEEGFIKNGRSGAAQTLPANCILITAMNLCRCGNHGSIHKKCICTAQDMLNYAKKISGPLSDRIDMWVPLRESAGQKEKISVKDARLSGRAMKESVAAVRKIQQKRILSVIAENNKAELAELGKREIKVLLVSSIRKTLSEKVFKVLNEATENLGLSSRSSDSTLLLSRTIADIEGSVDIKEEHILEALSYRKKL